jgi:uncharacterized protein (TIGR03435 family)
MPMTNHHTAATPSDAGIVQSAKLMPHLQNNLRPETRPRMKLLSLLAATLLAATLAPHPAHAQAADIPTAAPTNTSPQFAAATIKPPDPSKGGIAGFVASPGGRIFFGGNLNMLVQFAFRLQTYQIDGGPDWTRSEWFEVNAIPPQNSPSRKLSIQTVEPTAEQRQMLQSLLRDRFGLKFHMETKEGEVYLLTRGSKELQLKPPRDPAADPRANVVFKSTGIDGEAEGTNTTTDYLAERLGGLLKLPVINQTGITGSYDFHLPPVDPENHDIVYAVDSVVDRLGLAIKRSRGPIQTLVIDHVDHPSAN